jgi:hypothetical protein
MWLDPRPKKSFLTCWDRSGRLVLLKRWHVAFGRGQAASKLVWRRTVAGPKFGTPDRSHKGTAGGRLRLHPGRRLAARRWRLRRLSKGADRKDQYRQEHQKPHDQTPDHFNPAHPDPSLHD